MNTHIVGLAGTKGSGKDTAAKVFKANGYEDVKFAAPIKGMLRYLLNYRGADPIEVERMVEGDLKEVPTAYLEGKTPREAMQTLGTEWGRELVGEGLWVNSAMDRASLYRNVVISDVRFPNEVGIIHANGGTTYRIERESDNANGYSLHPSEAHIPNLPVTEAVSNEGTIDDLWFHFASNFEFGNYPDTSVVPVEFTVVIKTTIDPSYFDDDVVTETPLDVLKAELEQIVEVEAATIEDAIRMGEYTVTGRLL